MGDQGDKKKSNAYKDIAGLNKHMQGGHRDADYASTSAGSGVIQSIGKQKA